MSWVKSGPVTITTGAQAVLGPSGDVEMCVFNADGTVNTTATPSGSNAFDIYKYRDGTSPVSNPLIVNRGNGRWTFSPIQAHLDAGVAFVVQFSSSARPTWFYGAVCGPNNPFGVYVPFNTNTISGDYSHPPLLSSGRGLYTDLVGTNRTPPTPVLVSGGGLPVWSITPTEADLDVGILMRMGSPQFGVIHPDSLDLRLVRSGTAVDATKPVVTNISPATGVTLHEDDPITFDVTDSSGNLSRTTVLAYFPQIRSFEVVWFGGSVGDHTSGFTPFYTGTRSTITNGFRFTDVIRVGGWKAQPYIVADLGDSVGNESI